MTLDANYMFDHGEEYAPDSRTGLKRLLVMPDGRFRFHNRRGGELVVERTGAIALAAVAEIAGYLSGSGYPQVPDHPMPPGADYFTITSGERHASMDVTSAEEFPGYGPLIRLVIPWMKYLVRAEGPAPADLRLFPPKKS